MKKLLILLVVCFMLSTTMAQLDESWTDQCWDFRDDTQFGITPGQSWNQHGDPVAMIIDMSGWGVQWHQDGYWQGREFKIILDIPNQDIDNPYKLVWINVTYRPGPVEFLWVSDIDTGELFTLIHEETGSVDGWQTLHQVWRFEPNPREEVVVIGLKGLTVINPDGHEAQLQAHLDSICIRTQCVPEPTTLAVLGLGALALLGRKRI